MTYRKTEARSTLRRKQSSISTVRPTVESTVIRHENGASNRRDLKTLAFSFCVDQKHFENAVFRNRWHHGNPVISLARVFLKHKSKITDDCCDFQFLRRSVDGKHLMRLLSELWKFVSFAGAYFRVLPITRDLRSQFLYDQSFDSTKYFKTKTQHCASITFHHKRTISVFHHVLLPEFSLLACIYWIMLSYKSRPWFVRLFLILWRKQKKGAYQQGVWAIFASNLNSTSFNIYRRVLFWNRF